MRILIVASGNAGYVTPFIRDQVKSLNKINIRTEYFLIKGSGVIGYLKNFVRLNQEINRFKPDLIHAHYGLSGLLASLQRRIPVVVTFHGSDINDLKERKYSVLASKLCRRAIFVSDELAEIIQFKNPEIIPCGVDLDVFFPMDQVMARKKMNLEKTKKYILFSSSFTNEVKNYPLARSAVDLLDDPSAELIELKGFDRTEVSILMNAVDCVLMTSKTEGSPQFIKEAMATNTPIVSTDVGDVKRVIGHTEGCFISQANKESLSDNLNRALEFPGKTNGREAIAGFDNKSVALKLSKLYKAIK
jgi:glycosyltransferase involved in cell wall biosynthesis